MAKADSLKRLGGGGWGGRDGRFQSEPQAGTGGVGGTTQSNEFGLPLVRGPFPSLTAAKEAIEDAREAGPVSSPLAERIEEAVREAPKPDARAQANARAGKQDAEASDARDAAEAADGPEVE